MRICSFYILCVFVFGMSAFAGDVPPLLAEKFIQSYTSPSGSNTTLQDLESFEDLHTVGSSARNIYKMTLSNGEHIILKDLKEDKFASELDNLLKLEPFLTTYAEKATQKMPHFARYRGHFILEGGLSDRDQTTHHFILFDEAPGLSLFDWLEQLAPQDFTESDLTHIHPVFRKTGASIAQFHLAHTVEVNDTFKTILHSDFHMGNIFLEVEPQFRVTFIDYESVVHTLNKPTVVTWDLTRLFQFSLPGLKGKIIETTKINFQKNKKNIFLTQKESDERDEYVDTKLNQLSAFISSIAKGYDEEMRHHGWKLTKDRDDLVKVLNSAR